MEQLVSGTKVTGLEPITSVLFNATQKKGYSLSISAEE